MSEPTASVATTPPAPTTPDDLPWRLSYDRASVESHLAEVDVERHRLQSAIAVARARLEAINQQSTARRVGAMAELGELVVSAQDELAQLEQEHAQIVATIGDAAAIEAARVLAAAHREAEAMRLSTAALATPADPVAPLVAADEPPAIDEAPSVRPEVGGHADAG